MMLVRTSSPGVELLSSFEKELARHEKNRQELANAEKLFDLPITMYPELIKVQKEMSGLRLIYDLYESLKVPSPPPPRKPQAGHRHIRTQVQCYVGGGLGKATAPFGWLQHSPFTLEDPPKRKLREARARHTLVTSLAFVLGPMGADLSNVSRWPKRSGPRPSGST